MLQIPSKILLIREAIVLEELNSKEPKDKGDKKKTRGKKSKELDRLLLIILMSEKNLMMILEDQVRMMVPRK